MSFEYVKNIQQAAVFKCASTGASVYTAIVLLAQISVSFSMQQGRKYHLGKLLRCMVIWLYCLSVCLGMTILEGNPAKFSCRVANLETSLWRVRRPDGTFQSFAQSGVLYSQFSGKFQLEIHNESSKSNTSYLLTLTLNEATVDDHGQYRCEEEGQIRSLTSLTVERPGMTILEGNPAKFSCRVTSLETSLWRVQRPDGTYQTFAHNGRVYSQYREKFQLVIRNESSKSSTNYLQTLTLNEAIIDDDGQYRCEEEGQIRNWTSLTVESTPVLHLEINNTVAITNIDVVLNREVAVDCIAEGGKPRVTLSWRVNCEEESDRFIDNPPPSLERVTSTIHLFPTMEDKTLTCVATGQKVTPQTNVSVGLNIQYLPHCILVITKGTNVYTLTCPCNANPEVKKYEIYVNGSLFSIERKTTLPSDNPAVVFCNVTNDVGSFVTQPENLKPFYEEVPLQLSGNALVIGLSVTGTILAQLISIAICAVCVYRKKKKDAEETEEILHMNKVAAEMFMKPLPEEYDTTQDDYTPLKDANKEENPDKEDGSTKPDKQKDGKVSISTSHEQDDNQESENLMSNAEKA